MTPPDKDDLTKTNGSDDPNSQSGNDQDDPNSQNGNSGDTSAGTKNTGDDQLPKSWDDVFKHPRFAQLLDRAKTAEGKLKQIEDDNAAADADAAKAKGEFEKLYTQEQERANTMAAQMLGMKVKDAMRDYLDANHAGYAAKARWIMPFVAEIKPDVDDEAIAKAVKAAADAWVKDNPAAEGDNGKGGPSNRGSSHSKGHKMTDDELRGVTARVVRL